MARKTTKDLGAETPPATSREGVQPPLPDGLSLREPRNVLEPTDTELVRISPAVLSAALEAIQSPAFVVRGRVDVIQANARGRALLDSDRERVTRALSGGAAELGRFPVEHVPDVEVVVLPDLDGDARARLVTITRRWGLTPRQSSVLALVAQGESNRTVAARLGCSEKTVELHVSALLAKTRCASRAQLVAAFWTVAG